MMTKLRKIILIPALIFVSISGFFSCGVDRWPEYAKAMLHYQKEGKNAHDDAPDATTGVAEQFTRKGGVSVW